MHLTLILYYKFSIALLSRCPPPPSSFIYCFDFSIPSYVMIASSAAWLNLFLNSHLFENSILTIVSSCFFLLLEHGHIGYKQNPITFTTFPCCLSFLVI